MKKHHTVRVCANQAQYCIFQSTVPLKDYEEIMTLCGNALAEFSDPEKGHIMIEVNVVRDQGE